MTQRPKEQSEERRRSGYSRPKTLKTQKSSCKMLVSVFVNNDGILLADLLCCTSQQAEGVTWIQSRVDLSEGIVFLQDNVVFTRQPLCTMCRKIFTLKFWKTLPTHLIWSLRNSTSFLTLRNTTREEIFLALWMPYQFQTDGLQLNHNKFSRMG
jgi:hypothetical protein